MDSLSIIPGSNTIPFFGLDRQYQTLRSELLDVTDSVYKTGKVIDGDYTKQFELQIALRTNRKYAVAVSSCSMALFITYCYYSKYHGLKNVSLPAISFIATANAPLMDNWKLKFVDVDQNGLLDLNHIDDTTKVVSYVNLFGNVLNFDKLTSIANKNNLIVIEDAAQSFGACYNNTPSGKLGDVSCLSFDPTKNLPNYGGGGMILTDDQQLDQFARRFRNNGTMDGTTSGLGTNCKMSEADCAQMLVKLRYFDQWQSRRKQIAEYFMSELSDKVSCLLPNQCVLHSWHKFVIRTNKQMGLKRQLELSGIETKIHYSSTLISQIGLSSEESDFPVAHDFRKTCISLPIYPELTDGEVEHIVDTINVF